MQDVSSLCKPVVNLQKGCKAAIVSFICGASDEFTYLWPIFLRYYPTAATMYQKEREWEREGWGGGVKVWSSVHACIFKASGASTNYVFAFCIMWRFKNMDGTEVTNGQCRHLFQPSSRSHYRHSSLLKF
jgi:hypothetical protein